MTRRSIAGIFSGLLLLGGLVWWWYPRPPELAGTRPASKPVVQRPATTVAPAPIPTDALPTFGTEAFNQLAKERGAAWLASRNRDAVSLLAMWDLTGDETVLREAAEKFPGNPQVCLAMLSLVFTKGDDPAEQKKWIGNLIAADPENPLGYYFLARIAQDLGDTRAVIATLETALSKTGRVNHHLRERMVGAKEGLLASGVPLKDTYFLSLSGPLGKASAGIFKTNELAGFFKKELGRLKASGLEEDRQNLAELGLRLSEQQRLTESSTLISDLTALSWRGLFLKEMDPNTEIVNSGKTAGQELEIATLEKQRMGELMKSTASAHQYLSTAPLEVQGQYADRMMMDGEMAALQYLLEAKAKADP